MAQGFLHQSKPDCGAQVRFNQSALDEAIHDYDAAWEAYRAYGLANVFAPSLYHDYYFCLGTNCSGDFDPADPGDGGSGVGKCIDGLRGGLR